MERRRMRLENWQDEYRRKLVSPEEAAKAVRSGDNIFIPAAYTGEVVRAIAARHGELRDVKVEYQSPRYDPGWMAPGMEASFQIITRIFLADLARPLHDEGRIQFLPYTNGTWFKVYRDGRPARQIDVTVLEVSPPDENGFMTFGERVWERRHFVDRARTVIAEMDKHLIRSHGDSKLHVSQVDYLLDITGEPATEEEIERIVSRFPPEKRERARRAVPLVNPRRVRQMVSILDEVEVKGLEVVFGLDDPDDVARSIAGHLKPLLRDRDTLQIGIGKPSKFVIDLGVFDHLQDLSIFSEMACPGMGFLVKRGIATGRYAGLHPNKAVLASLDGMREEEIRWADDNPLFELYSSDYVVNIANIVRNENMVAINNALQVDLTGQINCETQFGPRLVNGPGGQIEFHIGAFLAPGGRAITLLPSTWSGGGISNIVPRMEEGSFVSIPRVFADYVITEWGVAQLAGKTHRERAFELVRVAHPDFRAELEEAARDIY